MLVILAHVGRVREGLWGRAEVGGSRRAARTAVLAGHHGDFRQPRRRPPRPPPRPPSRSPGGTPFESRDLVFNGFAAQSHAHSRSFIGSFCPADHRPGILLKAGGTSADERSNSTTDRSSASTATWMRSERDRRAGRGSGRALSSEPRVTVVFSEHSETSSPARGPDLSPPRRARTQNDPGARTRPGSS